MKYWRIPIIWEGETCAILGGGPSLAQVDISRLSKVKIIAVNDAYKDEETRQVRQLDCVYWKDKNWYDQLAFKDYPEYGPNRLLLTTFDGLKVTTCPDYPSDPGVHILQRGRRYHLELDRDFLTHSDNAGAEALALSTMFGCKTVLLFGFDMKTVNGKHNYHSNHTRVMGEEIYNNYYVKSFLTTAEDVQSYGVKIINCTKDSALNTLPFAPLEEVINADGSVRT